MKSASLGVGISAVVVGTTAFSIRPINNGVQREGALHVVPKASYVSVCTAELCCCQDDGLGGNEILADLLSRNLPYPVDEAPCLGACGGGAMVAIDFEDGTGALVSGLQETLFELGLVENEAQDASSIAPVTFEPVDQNAIVTEIDRGVVISEIDSKARDTLESSKDEAILMATKIETVKVEEKLEKSQRAKPKSVELVDVRDRMRAEAAKKDEERVNPWLNAAGYLAGKAAQQLFGSK